MRFSLITATLGRTQELARLLDSLARQTHRDFELIVVDQNADDRLNAILAPFAQSFGIRHLTSAPGLSRARNLGLRYATGQIIAFPDDDCWYPAELLSRVESAMAGRDALVGDALDERGRPLLPWNDSSGPLTRAMAWRRAASISLFFRAETLARMGRFDETLGLGSGLPWGCGEDMDLMLRTVEAGFTVRYEKALRVFHPRLHAAFTPCDAGKRLSYALGEGRLLRKHPMPLWWTAAYFAAPAVRVLCAALSVRPDEARFHLATLRGRLTGALSKLDPVHPAHAAEAIERT